MSFRKRTVLALIPARRGSKGVPGKNVRAVRDKPLIRYTVDAALGSTFIDHVCVSSDDPIALEIARTAGVQDLTRPEHAATDAATANDVLDHYVDTLDEETARGDPFIVYLQPTSPLRTSHHIDDAFRLLDARGSDILASVVPLSKSPFKAFIRDENGRLSPIFAEGRASENRQSLPQAYYPNGAIYIFRISDFRDRGNFPCAGAEPYVMAERDSLDIDTSEDFAKFEKMLEA